MTPELEREAARICEAALDLPAAEWPAFVAGQCGTDETLRRAVESLLRQQSSAEHFLQRPALDIAAEHVEDQRALLAGQRVGAYLIQGLLGAGGMGEVYRAHDTKLGRDVAIKILPLVFTSEPDRLTRFEREARLLAALNHPNIGAIYGVEDVGGTPGLILELLEGQTLADRLAKGPLCLSDALKIASQIADALEAAHERGIVHRDLKPSNIILRDLVAKVLDFGLAKAVAGNAPGIDLSQSPTNTDNSRLEGPIVGTAAYMSPEQARGLRVDKRCDVWAFGCMLYEMLTGRQAFRGDTLSDTIASVLQHEPDWRALPERTPIGIQRLLRRCLEKDVARRLRDMGDARLDIDEALTVPSQTLASSSSSNRRIARAAWILAPIALVGATALLLHAWTTLRTPPALQRVSRSTIATSGAATVTVNGGRSVAITPDGAHIVFVGDKGRQLFVRPTDQFEETAIFSSSLPLNEVFISPDSGTIGFGEGNTIKKIALTGGPAEIVVRGIAGFGATWAADGTIIFATTSPTTGLHRVSADGGAETELTRPAAEHGELAHIWPEMLQGGKAVLFTITATTGGLDAAQVAVFEFATGKYKVLVRGGSDAHYVPGLERTPKHEDGYLVYLKAGALRAVSFDLNRLETHGTAVVVLPLLASTSIGSGNFDVAADGTLVYMYAPGGTNPVPKTLVWVDRLGREEPVGAPPGAYLMPRVSPDGKQIAVGVGNDVWIWDLTRQDLRQLTFSPDNPLFPVWTTDSRRVIFGRGGGGLFWRAADGTGKTEVLSTASGAGMLPSAATRDGTRVLYSLGARDVMAMVLETHRVEVLVQTSVDERNGAVSPDGRWLLYESKSSGRFEIYAKPYPEVNSGLWPVSTAGGIRPIWAPSGRELFYMAPDDAIMSVRVEPRGGAWNSSDPVKVFTGAYETGGALSGRNYDVSPDGKRFLMIKQVFADPASAPRIEIVQHWADELKRLVPHN